MYEQRIKTVRRNLANRGLEQMLYAIPVPSTISPERSSSRASASSG